MITQKKFNRLIKILDDFLDTRQTDYTFPTIIIIEFKKANIWDIWVKCVNINSVYASDPMRARREEYPIFIKDCQKYIIGKYHE